ncbi:MAG: RNA polymerase sigma factor [Pseudomonadota bacterium]
MTNPPSKPEEQELLARIATGDETAMKALYERYASPLQYFVQSWLPDVHEAADVMHEAMLAVWGNAASFRNQSSVKSWVFGIARNKAIDRVRAAVRLVPTEPERFDEETDEVGDVHQLVLAMQRSQVVRDCIDGLSDTHKRAVHLAFFEDMPYAEIAEVEACPVGTVKSRILYAKQLIARCVSLKTGRDEGDIR